MRTLEQIVNKKHFYRFRIIRDGVIHFIVPGTFKSFAECVEIVDRGKFTKKHDIVQFFRFEQYPGESVQAEFIYAKIIFND